MSKKNYSKKEITIFFKYYRQAYRSVVLSKIFLLVLLSEEMKELLVPLSCVFHGYPFLH